MLTRTELPEQFGRYRILKRLGEGGMGAVYLAEDVKLGRKVALKVPHFTPEQGEQALARFYREARAAATLQHPNLCPVYDVGEVDGVHYLTMAFIDGRPLADFIDPDRPLSPRKVAPLVRKVALALHKAHLQGVVHRDLKPANIMLGKDGEPVVMDFGLARQAEQTDRLTRTGLVFGTPIYMAPEQIMGESGPSCDVYALGVVLYELLAGRLPFEGPPTAVLGQTLVTAPPPPSQYRAGIDPALEALCLQAMAKKPEERPANMAEFAAALEAWERQAPAAASRTRTTERRTCPSCGKKLLVPDSPGDKPLTCPACHKPLVPPSATVATQPPAPAAAELGQIIAAVAADAPRRRRSAPPLGLLAAGGAAVLLLGLFLGWLLFGRPERAGTGSALPGAADAKSFINSVGMKLVLVPAGKFVMGSPAAEHKAFTEEGPQHEIQLTRTFFLGNCEVTQGQYRTVTELNPSQFQTATRPAEYGDHPVEMVAWDDAVAFCHRLSERAEEKAAGRLYRLPTEAEWEYACRAGSTTAFASGAVLRPDEANFDGKQTRRVASYTANAWGLFDMHGNVHEWCQDRYDDLYYRRSPAADPTGPAQGALRVYRGGSWLSPANVCRSACRMGYPPDSRFNNIGFRVACVVGP